MLAHKFIVKALASALSSVLSLISLMVMSRYAGFEYGLMMWGWAFIGLINTVSDLGFNSATIRSISKGFDKNTCISTYITIKIILILTMVALVSGYISLSYMRGSSDLEELSVLIIFLVYYIISDFVWIIIYTFDGHLDVGKSSIIQVTEPVIRSAFLIILALAGASATFLSCGYIIGIISAGIIGLYLFRSLKFKFVRPTLIKEYVRFAKPVALGITMIVSVTFIDKVIIGFTCNSIDVGYYAAATGAAYTVTAIGTAMNNVLLPKFSKQNTNPDRTEMKHTLWESQKYLSLILIPVSVFVLIFGTEIATIFLGEGYAPAGIVLSILSIYIYTFVIAGVLAQLLHSTNKLQEYKKATIVFSIVTLTLFIVLIPDNLGGIKLAGLGINGAALALVVGYVVFLAFMSLYSTIALKMSLYPGLIKQFISAAIITVTVFGANLVFDLEFGIISLILTGMGILALHISLLYLMKEISRSDIRFIIDSINPRKLYTGVKEKD